MCEDLGAPHYVYKVAFITWVPEIGKPVLPARLPACVCCVCTHTCTRRGRTDGMRLPAHRHAAWRAVLLEQLTGEELLCCVLC